MGVKPWLELGYGNPKYKGGGQNGPGALGPNSTVALTAWRRWVSAVAHRYSNVTNEFEVWNEPPLGETNWDSYATLAAATCQALYNFSHPPHWTPEIFYGTMSGSYVSSGPIFLNGTLPLVEAKVKAMTPPLTLAQCVTAVTFHAYTGHGRGPEATYERTVTPDTLKQNDPGKEPTRSLLALSVRDPLAGVHASRKLPPPPPHPF